MRFLGLTILLLLPLCSWAQNSQVLVPPMFKLLYLNGEEQQKSFYNRAPLPLTPGRQQMVLQYQQAFDGEADSTYLSSPIVLYFYVQGQQTIVLQAKRPRNRKEAAAYVAQPKLNLIDKSNGQILPHEAVLAQRFGWQNGPNMALLEELEKGKQLPDQDTILTQLKLLYQNADESHQQAFQAWIRRNEQNPSQKMYERVRR
ncbi:DUF2057 family protein [Motilimonas pumila]|uniref:DUF2057 domain-containing protein n=1 Tax=Motilimonas pumila TaxID=2303987 RepID=A0A418YCJ5_9GAMM|nr:DUF2057 family protein [Motilimonas pumila]RJG42223.1 DUF2057 domain-containing protein [Motilimonas pumila]